MRYMMFVCTDAEPDTDQSPEPEHRRVGGGE